MAGNPLRFIDPDGNELRVFGQRIIDVPEGTPISEGQIVLARDPVTRLFWEIAAIAATTKIPIPIRVRLPGAGVSKFAVDDFPNVASKISQKQLRHIAGRKEYLGGGYLNNVDDAQKVLDAFRSGSTTILGKSKQGFPIVRCDVVTGTNVNVGAGISNQPTNIFMIKGTIRPSVVPMNPKWTP